MSNGFRMHLLHAIYGFGCIFMYNFHMADGSSPATSSALSRVKHIFYMNLDISTERRKYMESILPEIGISYERISSIPIRSTKHLIEVRPIHVSVSQFTCTCVSNSCTNPFPILYTTQFATLIHAAYAATTHHTVRRRNTR